MKRIRIFFYLKQILLAANFFVLGLLVIAWPLSYYFSCFASYGYEGQPHWEYGANIWGGRIHFYHYAPCPRYPRNTGHLNLSFSRTNEFASRWSYLTWGEEEFYETHSWAGVTLWTPYVSYAPYAPPNGDRGIMIPFSYLCLIFLIWPAIVIRRFWKKRRLARSGFPVETPVTPQES